MADDLELRVERHIAAPPAIVWAVMTDRFAEWFVPAPWRCEIVALDWRAGGRSELIFHGPAGEAMPQHGVVLEVVPGRHWVSTDAFTTGWRPAGPMMVGTWAIAADDAGTRYRASARHWTREAYEQHAAMGFEAGWGAAADQLKALCEGA